MTLFIGTAGWSISRAAAQAFDTEGPALQRYASRFRAAEINSSFHRSHRPATWAKWAGLVPDDFRFAVKMPKTITHQSRLIDCDGLLVSFLEEVSGLDTKLAVLLVQLPPKLAFDRAVAERFFDRLRSLTEAKVVCEPRHPSWFEAGANALLASARVSRAAADPSPVPAASLPGGWRDLSYWRLHGSPVMYRSPYGTERLRHYAAWAERERAVGREVWFMFDNTASSAAISDALIMLDLTRAS